MIVDQHGKQKRTEKRAGKEPIHRLESAFSFSFLCLENGLNLGIISRLDEERSPGETHCSWEELCYVDEIDRHQLFTVVLRTTRLTRAVLLHQVLLEEYVCSRNSALYFSSGSCLGHPASYDPFCCFSSVRLICRDSKV